MLMAGRLPACRQAGKGGKRQAASGGAAILDALPAVELFERVEVHDVARVRRGGIAPEKTVRLTQSFGGPIGRAPPPPSLLNPIIHTRGRFCKTNASWSSLRTRTEYFKLVAA